MNDKELRDIVINRCLDCNEPCPKIWFNKILNHKILCKCNCHAISERLKLNEIKKNGLVFSIKDDHDKKIENLNIIRGKKESDLY